MAKQILISLYFLGMRFSFKLVIFLASHLWSIHFNRKKASLIVVKISQSDNWYWPSTGRRWKNKASHLFQVSSLVSNCCVLTWIHFPSPSSPAMDKIVAWSQVFGQEVISDAQLVNIAYPILNDALTRSCNSSLPRNKRCEERTAIHWVS
jgi:hypothetical protein